MEKSLEETNKFKIYKRIDFTIILLAYLMLAIPIIMLLFFWFKIYISIPCIILLILGLILTIKKLKYKSVEEYKKIFNGKKIICIIILIVLLNILSGAAGVFYQNWDYRGRNAILHDLIEYNWPVKYDYSDLEYEANKIGNEKGFLSYYFAYWLPGAAVGKIFGFKAANLFLLLWQTIGTCIFFYLVCRKLNNVKIKYFIIFICFGGLDIITRFIMNLWNGESIELLGAAHIDTANGMFCMSTFITQLFWVFNQSLPAWIATMLVVNNKSYGNLGVHVALLLPFSPFPCLGLILLSIAIILFGYELDKIIDINRLKETFSIQNIISVISVIPIGLLFLQNSSEKGSVFIRAWQNGNLTHILIGYLLFILLEFGIYSIIITKQNRKKVLLYFALFAILPTFYLGGGLDLGNRATIPILILLYIEILKFADNENISKRRLIILYVILAIAACTNFNEFYRSITNTMQKWKEHKILDYNDTYLTFGEFENKECDAFIKNFVAPEKDNFFKKILK